MRASRRYMKNGMYHEMRGLLRNLLGRMMRNRMLGIKGTCERMAGRTQRRIGRIYGLCGL